jgi:hypothetical protein
MNVESRAHAEHELGVKLGEVLIHKPLLLRRAQAYPEEIRLRLGNHADEVSLFFRVEGTKWRSIGANHLHAQETPRQ